MTPWRILLDFACQDREHENLHRSARYLSLDKNSQCRRSNRGIRTCIPEWSGNTICVCDSRRLKQSRSPRPSGDDTGGYETRFDGARGGIKLFRLVSRVLRVAILKMRYEHHHESEEEADADDDACSR
jgi:hypothetical protein